MKQLTCEMCGGTDLIKQDGVFVCQNCGMKYSVEEAKKMMIEGTVDVQGTVKIDDSDDVENYLKNARKACKNEDWSSAEKYYSLVEQYVPSNLETTFFQLYCRAMNQLYKTDYFGRERTFNALEKTISTMHLIYNNTSEDKRILVEINNALLKMCNSDFVRILNATSSTGSSLWQKNMFKNVSRAFSEECKVINQEYHESFISEILAERDQEEYKERKQKEQLAAKIQREKQREKREKTGITIGAIIGGIVGTIFGIWLCSIIINSIRTPVGRLNNEPQNNVIVVLLAFGSPVLLGALIGGLIGKAIANGKNKN